MQIKRGTSWGRRAIGRAVTGAFALAMGVGFASSSARAAITYTDLYTLGTPAGYTSINATEYRHPFADGQIVGDATTPDGNGHATLWNGPDAVVLDSGVYTHSRAAATNGAQQFGSGVGPTTGSRTHALLWSGSAASVVDLHPKGYTDSAGLAISGSQQVGRGFVDDPVHGTENHAMLWNGTAASAVDLNPSGFLYSDASGTNGTQQVGSGYNQALGNYYHALLWSGTAASYVDLNPATFGDSEAIGIGGGQQVGYGGNAVGEHALLWNGTAASAVDLAPLALGLTQSYAVATNGTLQVGYGYHFAPTGSGPDHALLWSGTAASAFDLQSVLPASFTSSYAYSISGDTVYGIAIDTSGNQHAIAWSVPEPASFSLLALAGAALVLRRRRPPEPE